MESYFLDKTYVITADGMPDVTMATLAVTPLRESSLIIIMAVIKPAVKRNRVPANAILKSPFFRKLTLKPTSINIMGMVTSFNTCVKEATMSGISSWVIFATPQAKVFPFVLGILLLVNAVYLALARGEFWARR